MTLTAALKSSTFALLLLMIGASLPSAAQDKDEIFFDHVLRQIVCQYPPDPTATLLYLGKTKRIDLKKGERADSETCWPLRPALEIEGLGFTQICASAEDPVLIELFPRLYYRGPGTSPGTGLRLITREDQSAIDAWLKRAKERIAVSGETKVAISEASSASGKIEISCNSTSFLGE